MATVAAQGTMGQSGQRTLLPFFGKGLGSSSKPRSPDDPPDLTSNDFSTTKDEDVCENWRTMSNGIHVNDPAERVTKSHQKDNQGRQQTPEILDMDQALTDSGRRKRRKTGRTSQSSTKDTDDLLRSGVDTEAWQNIATNDPDDQFDGTFNLSEHDPEPSPGAPAENVTLDDLRVSTPGKKRKTLRLNPNGKLLSSPRHDPSADEQSSSASKKPTGRRKKRTSQENSVRSAIVSMKYGKDDESRGSTGELINDILNGRKRNKPSNRHPSDCIQPQGPPKPVHPFFLAKATQTKASDSKEIQGRSVTPEPRGAPKQSPHLAGLDFQPPSFLSRKETDNPSMNVSKSPRRANAMKPTDSLEPLWPPHGIVHVRGFPLPATALKVPECRAINYQEKKAKGSTLNVPQSESVFSVYDDLLADDGDHSFDTSKDALRQPDQVTLHGNKLKDSTMKKLSTVTPANHTEESQTYADKCRKKPSTTYAAITTLISSIPNARSSFERAEYDDTPWTQKYAPKFAEEVLQHGPEALMLRAWLSNHEVSAVNTGQAAADSKSANKPKAESGVKRKKRHKKPKDLDNFIVSSSDEEPQMDELTGPSDEEDELAGGVTVSHKRSVVRSLDQMGTSKHTRSDGRVANAALLSGPSGCGKTAAIYAVARELGFEVFEVNAGSRRSARDVVERVGDMTQNHLVHLLDQIDNGSPSDRASETTAPSAGNASGKQNAMGSFFQKTQPPENAGRKKRPAQQTRCEDASKSTRNQKQSLILLEEVDVLFEQDKNFWGGVLALISQSKRPVIMTCNDESLLPMEDLSLHAIFRFRPPPRDVAVDFLLLMAANEGHVLDRQPIFDLYAVLQRDLRASIMQLDFWCQMAVGSKKSGIDWLINCPSASTRSSYSETPRAVSWGTYADGMGWYNQDIAVGERNSVEQKFQLMMDSLEQWDIGVTDWHEARKIRSYYPDTFSRLDELVQEDETADVRSTLAILCRGRDATKDDLDVSAPSMSEKEQSNFVEGYHLIQADHMPDYTRLPTKIGAALSVLLEDTLEVESSLKADRNIVDHILESSACGPSIHPAGLHNTLEPLLETAGAFTHGVDEIAEDVAPYVRTIVAFDVRLEQHRLELSGRENKRARTTRASRAALEGGNKSTTRREKWFQTRLNIEQIMATGGHDWQAIMHGQEMTEELPRSTDSESDPSSSEGGI